MTPRGKRVLVTGAGGFIGSHLSERLVEQGAAVTALIEYNPSTSWKWLESSELVEEMDVVLGDIRDSRQMMNLVRGQEIIFHLAALIGIPYSYEAPASYIQTNVQGTMNLLEAARVHGIDRFVHTSTSEVYGTALDVPITEAHPLQAQSPYAASKIGADKVAESFHRAFGLPVVTVRPFNTFGPRQSTRAVIPTIITQCLSDGSVQLGNLHPTRDLNFVHNTVDGMLLASEASGAEGEAINLSTGKEISIRELAELIIDLTGTSATLETEELRRRPQSSEVDRLLGSNERAKELLGWNPKVSLEEGLKRTIDWFRLNLERYHHDRYAR